MTAAVDLDIREQAAQRFEQLGWPTMHVEEWKYTNLAAVQRVAWKKADSAPAGMSAPRGFEAFLMGAAGAAEYVFVNGIYAPHLSTPNPALQLGGDQRARYYA